MRFNHSLVIAAFVASCLSSSCIGRGCNQADCSHALSLSVDRGRAWEVGVWVVTIANDLGATRCTFELGLDGEPTSCAEDEAFQVFLDESSPSVFVIESKYSDMAGQDTVDALFLPRDEIRRDDTFDFTVTVARDGRIISSETFPDVAPDTAAPNGETCTPFCSSVVLVHEM